MSMRKAIVSTVAAAVMGVGVSSCTDDPEEYVVVLEYGYYDEHHRYYEYVTPKEVTLEKRYYEAHKSGQYSTPIKSYTVDRNSGNYTEKQRNKSSRRSR